MCVDPGHRLMNSVLPAISIFVKRATLLLPVSHKEILYHLHCVASTQPLYIRHRHHHLQPSGQGDPHEEARGRGPSLKPQ